METQEARAARIARKAAKLAEQKMEYLMKLEERERMPEHDGITPDRQQYANVIVGFAVVGIIGFVGTMIIGSPDWACQLLALWMVSFALWFMFGDFITSSLLHRKITRENEAYNREYWADRDAEAERLRKEEEDYELWKKEFEYERTEEEFELWKKKFERTDAP